MLCSNVSEATLMAAASTVGVHIALVPMSGSGKRWRAKVNPMTTPELLTAGGRRRRGKAGNTQYQRTSAGYMRQGRRVHAVCWHGFRDFFRAVYVLEPNAVFRTALATWKGSDHFEENFPRTGAQNIGCQIQPVAACEACDCPESGTIGQHTSQSTYGSLEEDIQNELDERDRIWRAAAMRRVTNDATDECAVYVPEFARGNGKA